MTRHEGYGYKHMHEAIVHLDSDCPEGKLIPIAKSDSVRTDGWHDITAGSFDLDSFEFISGESTIYKGGQSNVCAPGISVRRQERDRVRALNNRPGCPCTG
jgi:hypothetical protein